MLQISGNYMSTCVRRVLVCVYQFGLEEGKDFTFNSVEFDELKTARWLEKQPFGAMPVLEDLEEGFVLYESRAIARYLIELKGVLPTDSKRLALLDQAISIEAKTFDPLVSIIAYEKLYKGWIGRGEPDDLKVADLAATLATRLAAYEVILSKQRYLAGDTLTIADLFHLPCGTVAVDVEAAPGLVDGTLPSVSRWWKELSGLPSWRKANNRGVGP